MSAVTRHPFITFFILTYTLAWWFVPFESLGTLGLLVTALIVIFIT